MPVIQLQTILRDRSSGMQARNHSALETALDGVAADLALVDASQLRPDELYDEFGALVALYRRVRDAHAAGLAAGRAIGVLDRVVPIYYTLRSIQASLFLAYSMSGSAARSPDLSPVGTAIGLFDAPKVLAQETHVRSGTYDHDLAGFARWMLEIWTDMTIREADYQRFYGEAETAAAQMALRKVLGLTADGDVPEGSSAKTISLHEADALRNKVRAYGSDSGDIEEAVSVIESVGHEARESLIGMYVRRQRNGLSDSVEFAAAEAVLQGVLKWPYPVGETPILDLDAEQRDFDELLAEVPREYVLLRAPASQWHQKLGAALIRACTVEQSLRDHPEEYPAPVPGGRSRTVRWYIWEFLELVREATSAHPLGVRTRPTR